MKLLNGNVLVKDIKEEKKTEGGLIIPSSTQKTFVRSEVIAFDENIKALTKGDVIKIAANHQGHTYAIEGQDHRIINAGAILEIED